jgi:amino acid transporter
MGFRDLVLFYVVTGISLRWIATAASVGPSSIAVWMGAWLLFYLPLALSVIELSSRYPSEGGMYVWASEAFGDGPGFLAGWLYWSSNLPYFPTVLYFAASNILFLRADWRGQSYNQTYFLWFSIAAMTVLTVVNLVGLNVAKWTYNVGALGMWIAVAMVVVLGIAVWGRFGSATAFSVKILTPTFELKSAMLWATLVFALGGCEAAAFLGGEIKDARRNLPRGLLIAGVTVAFCYMMGTFFVLLALPSHETSILDGVIQAIERSASRLGIPGVTSTAAILIAVSNIGAAAAFLAAAARLPFVAGMEGLLPKARRVSSDGGHQRDYLHAALFICIRVADSRAENARRGGRTARAWRHDRSAVRGGDWIRNGNAGNRFVLDSTCGRRAPVAGDRENCGIKFIDGGRWIGSVLARKEKDASNREKLGFVQFADLTCDVVSNVET